ncbi:MAG: hypothetical protein ABJD68_09975, partial [Nakamurella sp.]
MAKYVYLYTGGKMAETPAEQQQEMQAWGGWFGELGSALTEGGNPFAASVSVGADGSVSNSGGAGISGYSVISADSLSAAGTLAKGCPVLAAGGAV